MEPQGTSLPHKDASCSPLPDPRKSRRVTAGVTTIDAAARQLKSTPETALEYEANGISDELLMVRYQRGDRDAFATLVRRHKSRVYNFVLRHLRNGPAAEDVAQDVFLRVVQKAADFKHEARFSTWLFAIARNLCIDHQRKQSLRRHPSLDQPSGSDTSSSLGSKLEDPHPVSNVERGVVSKQLAGLIQRAVDDLPDEQREVFLLREIANLPFKEIAEVTGVGENTVKSRMRYSLERLQAALKDFEQHAKELT